MRWLLTVLLLVGFVIAVIFALRTPAPEVFHADFVGSEVCGDCHWINYDEWKIF